MDVKNRLFTLLACPICSGILSDREAQLVCENGHSFDRSKEGYVNLLAANMKGSNQPGDSKQAAAARRGFLEKGYYQPVAELISGLIAEYLPSHTKTFSVVDSGCGEGYYLEQLLRHHPSMTPLGFDISKFSIRLAARHRAASNWFVANAKALPLQSESIDVLLNCFSPFFPENFDVIKKGGLVIFINGAENHLVELRDELYKEKRAHRFVPQYVDDRVELLKEQKLEYVIDVDLPGDLRNLVRMAPHHYRTSSKAQELFIESVPRRLTVDVVGYVYRIQN